jgi:glycosyltransferase involved in cell wall biosynthesis
MSDNERKKIIVSVISDLTTDQRVIRICTTLQAMGFEVLVMGRNLKGSLPLEKYVFTAIRLRCFFTRGTLQYAEFMIKLFFRLFFTKTDYLLANDLDTLLPNFLVSRLRRKYLFYDTHEYFTEVEELTRSPFKKKIWKKIEDNIFPKLKTVYTVTNSVRNAYEKEYPIHIGVIRNLPVTVSVTPAPIPENWKDKIILIVQGAGMNMGKSCIEMIDALPLLGKRFHLVFIGGGTAWNLLKRRRQELQLHDRIDMIDRMPPAKLKTYTAIAHLGISLESPKVKNYLYSLPNKVVDYIHAGVPVLATAVPEVKQIIDEYKCGLCITDTSPGFIARTITELFNDEKKYQSLKANTKRAAEDLCWEKEQGKLEDIYRTFL